MIPLSGLLLGAAARQAGKRGKRFSRRQLEGFAADLRRELYSRASLSGEWIDISDYVSRQPYFPGTWFMSVYHILYKQGVVANPTPRMTAAGTPAGARQAADSAATELQQSEPSRIPAILERLCGIASVAARGFEAVSPILEALRTVVS